MGAWRRNQRMAAFSNTNPRVFGAMDDLGHGPRRRRVRGSVEENARYLTCADIEDKCSKWHGGKPVKMTLQVLLTWETPKMRVFQEKQIQTSPAHFTSQ